MVDDGYTVSGVSAHGMDSETASLLRSSILPTINQARDWRDLNTALNSKGFMVAFRDGRLIFKRIETDEELCTGRFLGAPLRELARRFGRPCIRADTNGHTGSLMV